LRAGQLVVLESTTYPGTTEEVMIPILEKENRAGLKAARNDRFTGKEFFVAFSPEREDPGNTTVARRDIPKVVGGLNPHASELAGAMYGSIFARTVPVSSPAVAEMTKAAGEHLPLRQYRSGERTQAALLCAWVSTSGK
jgi:UDP-N-acetyl-D-glucosamine dehydrogenase